MIVSPLVYGYYGNYGNIRLLSPIDVSCGKLWESCRSCRSCRTCYGSYQHTSVTIIVVPGHGTTFTPWRRLSLLVQGWPQGAPSSTARRPIHKVAGGPTCKAPRRLLRRSPTRLWDGTRRLPHAALGPHSGLTRCPGLTAPWAAPWGPHTSTWDRTRPPSYQCPEVPKWATFRVTVNIRCIRMPKTKESPVNTGGVGSSLLSS